MWFLSQLYTEGLLRKPTRSSDLSLIGPRPCRHTPRLIVMHIVFRSHLKIFEYTAKQACRQLQCNKAKLSEPASINELHIHRALGYASRTNNLLCTLDENIGGRIYTLLQFCGHVREISAFIYWSIVDCDGLTFKHLDGDRSASVAAADRAYANHGEVSLSQCFADVNRCRCNWSRFGVFVVVIVFDNFHVTFGRDPWL